MNIKSATAIYTGGGIYIFYGETAAGTWWMGGTDIFDYVRELDADPRIDTEESGYPEWQDAHIVKDYEEKEARRIVAEAIEYILKNRPNGNYLTSELEERLARIKSDLSSNS